MIGEKALGEKLAKRLEEYAAAWATVALGQTTEARAAAPTPVARERAAIVADVLRALAAVIRDVTQ